MGDLIIEYSDGVRFNVDHYKRVSYARDSNREITDVLVGKTIRLINKPWHKEIIMHVETDSMYGDVVKVAVTDRMVKTNTYINNRIVIDSFAPRDREVIQLVKWFKKNFEIVE